MRSLSKILPAVTALALISVTTTFASTTPALADNASPACYLSKYTPQVTGLSIPSAQDMYNNPKNWTNIPWCDPLQGVYLGDLDLNSNGVIDSLEPAPTPAPSTMPTPVSTPSPASAPSPASQVPHSSPTPKPENVSISPTPIIPTTAPTPSPAVLGSSTSAPVKLAAIKRTNYAPFLAIIAALLIAITAGGYTWVKRQKAGSSDKDAK